MRRPPKLRSRSVTVAALVAVVVLTAGACSGSSKNGNGPGGTSAGGSSKGSTTLATVLTAPTAPPTTALQPVDLRPGKAPPWSAAKITAGTGRQTAIDEWAKAPNKATANALIPRDLALSPIATPRPSTFNGGWAVAWDDPGKPGVLPSGAACQTCGRGVAGVAGVGGTADKAAVLKSPITVQWDDGSAAGYSGPRANNPQFLATLYVAGQASGYQVWSYISQRHLEYLISQLRFVEGAP